MLGFSVVSRSSQLQFELFLLEKSSLGSSIRTNYSLFRGEFGVRLFSLVYQETINFVSAKHTVVAWAAIKYHRLVVLNHSKLLSLSFGGQSSRSACQHGWFLVRTLFLACQQLLSHCVFTWQGESKFSDVSSNKGTNPIMRSSPSCSHLNLIISQRSSYWGLGLQHIDFEGDTVQTIAQTLTKYPMTSPCMG